jgi:putative salt-induced outer membrane protein YdiY
MRLRLSLAACLAGLLASVGAAAQDCPPCPPPPGPGWDVSFGGGLSLTGGNSDANSYNLNLNAAWVPEDKKRAFRAEALYLRADKDGEATVDRTTLLARYERTASGRLFLFVESGYQRDRFKQLDYLIAPLAGLGLSLVSTDKVTLSLDTALGAALEKLEGRDATSNLALKAGQRFEWKASPSATLFEKTAALWKTNDFGDAYYRFEAGLTATLGKRLDLKLSFADDYKTRPPDPTLEKNDTSFVVSLLFKP